MVFPGDDTSPPYADSGTNLGSEASASGPILPVGGGYGTGDGFRFSARTCLALLPLLEETAIDYELTFLESYNLAPCSFRPRSIEGKREALKLKLCTTLCAETDRIVANMGSLRSSFSDTLRNQTPATADVTCPPPFPSPESDPGKRPEPVSVLNDVDFCELNPVSFLESIKAIPTTKMHGNREVCYMGKQPYYYGRNTRHLAAEYPDNSIIDGIFEKMSQHVPTFNKDNYSLLVTVYKDGKSYISPHSDNERSLMPGSMIYTVSLGASRDILFTNEVGRVDPRSHRADHGSVSAMSQESQQVWLHEIKPDRSVSEQRVSLTFRHMKAADQLSEELESSSISSQRPALQHPTTQSPEPQPMRRTLFLTDSILSGTPPYLLAAPNHTCIKKINYKLVEIFDYEGQFGYTDQVVLSGGVNDLDKYGYNAQTLSLAIENRLVFACRRNPDTQFVFNSILRTSHGRLNKEIVGFNRFMSDLCTRVHNLTFFDSDGVLARANLREVIFPKSRENRYGNGIHIVLEARKVIVRDLASCLRALAKPRRVN